MQQLQRDILPELIAVLVISIKIQPFKQLHQFLGQEAL